MAVNRAKMKVRRKESSREGKKKRREKRKKGRRGRKSEVKNNNLCTIFTCLILCYFCLFVIASNLQRQIFIQIVLLL